MLCIFIYLLISLPDVLSPSRISGVWTIRVEDKRLQSLKCSSEPGESAISRYTIRDFVVHWPNVCFHELRSSITKIVNLLRAKLMRGRRKTYLYLMLFLHIDMTKIFKNLPHVRKTRTCLLYIVNIMAADDLATQEAKAPATMISNMLNRIDIHVEISITCNGSIRMT